MSGRDRKFKSLVCAKELVRNILPFNEEIICGHTFLEARLRKINIKHREKVPVFHDLKT